MTRGRGSVDKRNVKGCYPVASANKTVTMWATGIFFRFLIKYVNQLVYGNQIDAMQLSSTDML